MMLYVYLGAATFYLLSIGGAGWYGLEQGKKLERTDWLERDAEQRQRMQQGLAQVVEHVRKEESAEHKNTMRALNDHQKRLNKINTDYAALLDTNKRLRFKADRASCSNDAMQGKGESSGVSAGTVTIELPEKIERGIRAVGNDAELELEKCNTLKDIIEQEVEVIGTKNNTEAAQ